jgi:ketosteroid isomerase-like protein
MATKVRALISVSLAIVGIGVVAATHAQATSDSDKAEVMALNQHLITAYNSKDVSAIMAFYSDDPNAIFFEDTIPLQFNKATLAKATEMFYKSVSDFHARVESVDVLVSGDLGVVHYIVLNTWTDKSGTHSQTSRYTGVDRKEGGKWLVWHEHFSVPFDPATGKAVLNAKA